MNLYFIDFFTSTNTEDKNILFFIISSHIPNKKYFEKILTDYLYCGAVYIDSFVFVCKIKIGA